MLFFFNSKSMNLVIPYKKRIKILSLIFSILFVIIVIIYSAIIIKINKLDVNYSDTEFQPSKFTDSDEVVSFDFSNLYSIDLPLNKVKIVRRAFSIDGLNISFANVEDSLAIMIYHPQKDAWVNDDKLKSLNKSDLNISRKIMNEKFGLKYLLMQNKIDFFIFQSLYQLDFLEFKNEDLVIQYTNFGKLDTKYTFYKNKMNIGEIHLFNLKSEKGCRNNLTIETNFINKLVSSIRTANEKITTAEDYYAEGLILYKNNQYKRAFLKFYSSLSVNSNNIDCKLYLLKAFVSTNNFTYPNENSKWYRAKVSLEKMLNENPDNKNIKDFYEYVKSESDKYVK